MGNEKHKAGTTKASKLWLAVGGLLLSLLLAAVFTLGSLQIPFEPGRWNEVLLLFSLSTFIVALFVVFLFVFLRTLLRTWAERRAEQLGGRFKTKMVAGAMAIAMLPVVFMFFISYALLNRTLNRWFPRPLEMATEESQKLLNDLGRDEFKRLQNIAIRTVELRQSRDASVLFLESNADASWTITANGQIRDAVLYQRRTAGGAEHKLEARTIYPSQVRTLPSGLEIWEAGRKIYFAGRTRLGDGSFVVARLAPEEFLRRYSSIEAQTASYFASNQQLRALKNQLLLALGLFTVLLLFSATWAALFLSKQVTVPIQALAEGTRAVSAGDFEHRVDVHARDELGVLVSSFNQMTEQLSDSRKQINEFTSSLQLAVTELERRRKVMEAILENIPTAVFALDEQAQIQRVSPAAVRIFGEGARNATSLPGAIGEEAARAVGQLMTKSLRMGTASKELEVKLPGRVLHAAVTVSSLGPRRANPGYVVVIDDLTDLLRAQKSAAWQSVAQRIAHEIKNPLTPIQLSTERLRRYLDKSAEAGHPQQREIEKLVGESSALILREVTTLKTLVDEFSQFARFPTVKPEPADVNAIIRGALDVFHGRLDGVEMQVELGADLPPVPADRELLRRVLVNLVDNAAEAMEGSKLKQLRVETRLATNGETLEIVVADTGHGISPEDKDKLFLPHFSTRDRGTGLGLAIASRIVAEHHGTIRVEDNSPVGARFVVRLPVAEVHVKN